MSDKMSMGEYEEKCYLESPKPEPMWRKKDGTMIKVCDMSSDHILNTIKMLQRYSELLTLEMDLGFSILGTVQGEMAQASIESDIDRIMYKQVNAQSWIKLFENRLLTFERELT